MPSSSSSRSRGAYFRRTHQRMRVRMCLKVLSLLRAAMSRPSR
jgi:hypothetical protein